MPIFNPYSAGINSCRRQILMTKVDPRTVSIKYLYWAKTHNIGFQMNREDLTKTLMVISN